MIHCTIHCLLQGEDFSPAELAKTTDLALTSSEEKGTIGKLGRYKDQPVPDGSACIESNDFEGLVATLHQHYDAIRRTGATTILLTVTMAYRDQCNWEVGPEQMKLLGEMGISLGLTCYRDEAMS